LLAFNFFKTKKHSEIPYEKDTLCGTVLSYPQEINGNYFFEFLSVYAGEKRKFAAYLKNAKDLIPEEKICFKARIDRPYDSRSPGSFNWSDFLAKKEIYLVARGESFSITKKAGFFFEVVAVVRNKILKSFEENLSPDKAAVLSGIVIGYKKKMDEELKEAFSISGTTHILVASGGNVAILIGFFIFIFRHLGFPIRISVFGGLIASAFYVFVCGLDPPLTRAFFMAMVAIVAFIIERKKDPFQMLILAAFFLLLIKPSYIFDAGFQMSFAAVYGLAVGFGTRRNFFSKNRPYKLNFFLGVFFATLFAQIALSPLLIAYFNRISIIGLLSNMIVVPLASILLPLGLISSIFSKISFISGILFKLCSLLVDILIKSVLFFSNMPLASIYVPSLTLLSIFALCFLVFIFLHWPIVKAKKILLTLSVILIFSGFVSQKNLIKKEFLTEFSRNGEKGFFFSRAGKLFILNPWNSCQEIKKSVFSLGFTKLESALYITKPKTETALCLKKELGCDIAVPYWDAEEWQSGLWPGDIYKKNFLIEWDQYRKYYSSGNERIKYTILK